MDRSYLSEVLGKAGIQPLPKIIDKVLEFQRLLSIKIAPGPFSRRCCALIELSCRVCDIPCSREAVCNSVGYKVHLNDYMKELGLLKSTLRLNFDQTCTWEKLLVLFGENLVNSAKHIFKDFVQAYHENNSSRNSFPIDFESPSYICACLIIAAEEEKVR